MRDVVERMATSDGLARIEIVRRADGLLQVFLLRWIEEVVPGHGKVAEFWDEQSPPAPLTDDLERARALGRELLSTVKSSRDAV